MSKLVDFSLNIEEVPAEGKSNKKKHHRILSAGPAQSRRASEVLDDMRSSNKSDRLSVSSQSKYTYQRFHTNTSAADLTKLEKAISEKLSYEWKNIYRSLVAVDSSQTSQVSANRFN